MAPAAKKTEKKKFNPWKITTIVLFILFALIIVYERSPNVHNGMNMILGITSDRYPILEQVRVDVLGDVSVEEPGYDYNEILDQIEEEFEMEFIVTEVDVAGDKGENYINTYEIASIPVLLFEEDLSETKFYDETKESFKKQDEKYVLQLKPYKFLELPSYELGHKRGAENPKVTIVEYSSLSCGYCGTMKPLLTRLLEEYPDDVQLIYKHFNRGGIDMLLENATECASEQGKFWEMHDYIFDNQSGLSESEPKTFLQEGAIQIGLNMEQFNSCVEQEKYAQVVNAHTSEGYKFGVSGTPAFFINDLFIGGAVSYDTLKEAVDSFIQ